MTVSSAHPHPRGTSARFGSGAAYSASISPDAFLSLGCMEGMYESIVAPTRPVDEAARPRNIFLPGYLAAGLVAAAAYGLYYLPIPPFRLESEVGVRRPISAATVAILVGLLIRNLFTLPDEIKEGCKRIVKKGIPVAIVLSGAGLNLLYLVSIGATALLIVISAIVLAVAAGLIFGRLVGLSKQTSLLLGVGTGICGNSAIVAVAPLVDAEDDDLVLSIGAVNLFGLLAMLALPPIGAALLLPDAWFGVWAGVSIHAVPQVVAAGFAFSPHAGTLATAVKLVRVALLAPLVFVLALLHSRGHATQTDEPLTIRYARLVPWFVWGFLGLAVLNTLGLIPTLSFQPAGFLGRGSANVGAVQLPVGKLVVEVGHLLLVWAMAAIGLEVNLRQLVGVGGRALIAGLAASMALAAASLFLIRVFM